MVGGAREGVPQPARMGPSAHQAQFPGHSVTRRSHTRLSPLGWEEGKQITYHPHWGTVGEDGRAAPSDAETVARTGSGSGKRTDGLRGRRPPGRSQALACHTCPKPRAPQEMLAEQE